MEQISDYRVQAVHMIKQFACGSAMLMVFTLTSIGAEPDPAAARTFTAHLQQGGNDLAAKLGHHGAWLVQSRERFDQIKTIIQDHNATIDNQLGEIDFKKENLAFVFNYGDEADIFSVKSIGSPRQTATPGPNAALNIDLAMSYIEQTRDRGLRMGVWRCFAVPVGKYASNRVSVYTYHPGSPGAHSKLDDALLEWQWTISPRTGESGTGLCAEITAKPDAPADDILIQFTLKADGASKVETGRFIRTPAPNHVWDGKYSNGYRNHAFEVITPDGQLHLVRPKEVGEWGKNAPHPVEVTQDKPYALPSWKEEKSFKSLKELGLDLTKPGLYRVTGIYSEMFEPIQNNNPEMWGGIIRSNTLEIERK